MSSIRSWHRNRYVEKGSEMNNGMSALVCRLALAAATGAGAPEGTLHPRQVGIAAGARSCA